MAKPIDKPIAMKIVADHVEESPEISEMVDRLEAEADREIAAGTVTLRWVGSRSPSSSAPQR